MKRGKFFCENCGTEVRPNSKVCPTCGRFFRAVRCPVCSFTGESSLFLSGCPSCGYAGEGKLPAGDRGFEVYSPEEVEGGGEGGRLGVATRHRAKASTPSWVYWMVFGIIFLAFGVLVLIYINL